MWLFYYFDFKRNYDDIKSKGSCILLNKNINFNKNETDNRKWKITHTVLGRRRLCFSLYKNRKLKVKLMIWSSRKKIEGIFCTAYFVWRKFFNLCALSQGIVYWIHFQNIHTFTYQKTLLQTPFCLFLQSPKAASVSFIKIRMWELPNHVFSCQWWLWINPLICHLPRSLSLKSFLWTVK